MMIRLADSLVLPLNCSDYAESLEDYLHRAVTLYELKLKDISMGKGERERERENDIKRNTVKNEGKLKERAS